MRQEVIGPSGRDRDLTPQRGPVSAEQVRTGLEIIGFGSAAAFEAWLAAAPATSTGAWLRLVKKGAGEVGLTRAEAVDAALCHGWIDGQQDRYDEVSWLIRITPRRRASRWSQINRSRALELIELGRMQPTGKREIAAAQSDGRWDAAYPPASTTRIPFDLQLALDNQPRAAASFAALKGAARYSLLNRLANVKKPETRARLIADCVRTSTGQEMPDE
jgi:uncharacterized protein YdeI (YjbR/CyaY-like superfamily)